jgi:hypothetical protein
MPNKSLSGGGEVHHHYEIDARGADAGVEQQR